MDAHCPTNRHGPCAEAEYRLAGGYQVWPQLLHWVGLRPANRDNSPTGKKQMETMICQTWKPPREVIALHLGQETCDMVNPCGSGETGDKGGNGPEHGQAGQKAVIQNPDDCMTLRPGQFQMIQ